MYIYMYYVYILGKVRKLKTPLKSSKTSSLGARQRRARQRNFYHTKIKFSLFS